ncbi:MAG: diaminopimelate epimerase [Coriobacteriia bacterium]|nr:diaminopimelate epimerase [Coriobacteriia bacterium]
MQLQFDKIHGTGNDFIVINDLSAAIELNSEQVRRLCDRHFGIGADGLILVRPSEHDDCAAYMHYINSDGSLAEMCGNGVRCFAKYLVDNGLVSSGNAVDDEAGKRTEAGKPTGSLIADTRAGKKPIRFTLDADGRLATATVDMGEPRFAPELIPTMLPATGTISTTLPSTETNPTPSPATEAIVHLNRDMLEAVGLTSPPGAVQTTCVSMGNPHCVIFLDGNADLSTYDVALQGARIEKDARLFPQGANVEFVVLPLPESSDDGHLVYENGPTYIQMRVWERGCGETLSCGTGACATAVAAAALMGANRHAVVHLLGGELVIEWSPDNHVYLTGPAQTVFRGIVEV